MTRKPDDAPLSPWERTFAAIFFVSLAAEIVLLLVWIGSDGHADWTTTPDMVVTVILLAYFAVFGIAALLGRDR